MTAARTGTVRRALPGAALAVVLVATGWHTAWNLGGRALGLAHAVALPVLVLLVLPWARTRLEGAPPWVRRRAVPAVAGLVVAGLVVAYVLGVPAAWAGPMGVGSDRADALGAALGHLAEGRYPYTATSYLGHPISPLPGALLLAAPFWWATGDAGAQNLVWLPLLLLVLHHGARDLTTRPWPTVVWSTGVLGGFEVWREFVVGDDLVTGTVPAVAAAALCLHVARTGGTAAPALAGIALGVTTCTRPHLVLVLLVVVAAVGTRSTWRRALVVGGAAAATWAVLVVPFLLGGLARFSPLHVAAKVTGERGLSVGIVVVALAAAAVLLVVLRLVRPADPVAVGWCAAAVLFAPTVLSFARGVVQGPGTDVDLTLGAAAIPFALWAVARRTGDAGGEGEAGDARAVVAATAARATATVPRALSGGDVAAPGVRAP